MQSLRFSFCVFPAGFSRVQGLDVDEPDVAMDWPDLERRPPHCGHDHLGACRDRSVGAADREPPLPRQADVPGLVEITDDIEGQHFLADERAVDTATDPACVTVWHA